MKGKRIAVVGAGSIGLYYGSKLAAQGCDIRFLMRSGFRSARESGIRVHSGGDEFHLPAPRVADNPRDIGACDGVIVSVKATSNESLPALITPLIGDDTWILTMQNGLGNEEFLARHFGAGRIMGALCFVCLTRSSPVVVNHFGHGTLSLGEYARAPLERTRDLAGAFRSAGIETSLVSDLSGERWRKLVWNIPFNGLCTAENVAVDRVLEDPGLYSKCRALMDEVRAIAASEGHEIPPAYADFQIERTRPMGAYLPSTLVDARAGNPLEIDPIWGEPLRRAQVSGVPAPHLAELYKRLKP